MKLWFSVERVTSSAGITSPFIQTYTPSVGRVFNTPSAIPILKSASESLNVSGKNAPVRTIFLFSLASERNLKYRIVTQCQKKHEMIEIKHESKREFWTRGVVITKQLFDRKPSLIHYPMQTMKRHIPEYMFLQMMRLFRYSNCSMRMKLILWLIWEEVLLIIIMVNFVMVTSLRFEKRYFHKMLILG